MKSVARDWHSEVYEISLGGSHFKGPGSYGFKLGSSLPLLLEEAELSFTTCDWVATLDRIHADTSGMSAWAEARAELESSSLITAFLEAFVGIEFGHELKVVEICNSDKWIAKDLVTCAGAKNHMVHKVTFSLLSYALQKVNNNEYKVAPCYLLFLLRSFFTNSTTPKHAQK